MPTIREMTRGVSGGSRIRLRFAQPILLSQAWEFHRVKLTQNMLNGGEIVNHRLSVVRRGVVGVEVAPDWIINPHEPKAQQLITGCLLVMDRRYREEVLAAVYRTAGMVADDIGVRIL